MLFTEDAPGEQTQARDARRERNAVRDRGAGGGRLPEWECQRCAKRNFMDRDCCRLCGAARPVRRGASQPRTPVPPAVRQGGRSPPPAWQQHAQPMPALPPAPPPPITPTQRVAQPAAATPSPAAQQPSPMLPDVAAAEAALASARLAQLPSAVLEALEQHVNERRRMRDEAKPLGARLDSAGARCVRASAMVCRAAQCVERAKEALIAAQSKHFDAQQELFSAEEHRRLLRQQAATEAAALLPEGPPADLTTALEGILGQLEHLPHDGDVRQQLRGQMQLARAALAAVALQPPPPEGTEGDDDDDDDAEDEYEHSDDDMEADDPEATRKRALVTAVRGLLAQGGAIEQEVTSLVQRLKRPRFAGGEGVQSPTGDAASSVVAATLQPTGSSVVLGLPQPPGLGPQVGAVSPTQLSPGPPILGEAAPAQSAA